MEAKTEQEQTQEQTRALVVVKEIAPDDPDGGLYEVRHWAQLIVAALGMLVYPRRFVSVAVPAAVAEALASRFRAHGFGAHIGPTLDRDGVPHSRDLSVWQSEGPTPAERMRAAHGRALHRDGLVIEEGYRRAVEMTDEDVRQGAWFG